MEDHELIASLGGPRKVAELLGFGKWGENRVRNWLSRGIPASVKLDYPHIFLQDILSKGGKRRASK